MKIEKGMRHPIRNGVVDKSKIVIRVTVNGKTRPKTIDSKLGIKVARRIYAEMYAEMNKSDYVSPTKMSLAELTDHYIDTQIKEVSVKQAFRNNFIGFTRKSSIASMRIDRIRTYDIQNVVDQLVKDDMASSTVNNYFAPISASLNHAETQSLLPHSSPTRNVRVPAIEETDVNMWSVDQYNAFISNAYKIVDSKKKLNQFYGNAGQYLKMIEFIRQTGCRIYEAIGLQQSDFNVDTNELSFNRTAKYVSKKPFPVVEGMKTKKSKRTIPLTDQATKILEELFIGFENPYIFNLNGKPFYPSSVGRIFSELRDELEMPVPFRLRDIRKIFITEMLDKGVPIHDVADYCGTSILQISRTYARSTKSSQLELIKKMSVINA
tara:strand:- start:712 stop:1848 length:1137 start_codon:yes stop_codon:yes gene_type:complete